VQHRDDALDSLYPLGQLHRRLAQVGDQRSQLPPFMLQADVLLRLRPQGPFGVCRQRLEPTSIGMARHPGHGGLDVVQHPG